MSEEPSSNSTQDLFFLFALIGGLFILWFMNGGPEQTSVIKTFQVPSELRNNSNNLPFDTNKRQVKQTANKNPANIKQKLKNLKENLRQARLKGTASPYEGMVKIQGGRSRERYAQTEYLELAASRSNNMNIPITGWVLESVVTGQRATIGKATTLPYLGKVNIENTLVLSPGDTVIVTTGYSPIGINFKTNLCVGYFEQFQNFSPRLQQKCANPTDEFDKFSTIPVTNVRLEDDKREICRNFIRRDINRCEINRTLFTETRPKLDNKCRDFIEKTYTYSGCVANHLQDLSFFENKWRVFLNSPAELWREKREIIRLLDQNGRTVDIYDY